MVYQWPLYLFLPIWDEAPMIQAKNQAIMANLNSSRPVNLEANKNLLKQRRKHDAYFFWWLAGLSGGFNGPAVGVIFFLMFLMFAEIY